ncbi:MAG: hypothetical protein ACFE0K_02960 [Alcanivorax sp.]|uniref:hypothetical protein n=1 Tax=Alcanivorax sp. TaxID=1872427 RepID=UPI003DA6DE93
MVVKVGKITADQCGIGLSVRGGGNVEVDAVEATNTGIAVHIAQEPSLISRLGLPADTDPAAVRGLLETLLDLEPAEREGALKKSPLWSSISGAGLSAASFVSNLLTIYKSFE